MGNKIKKYSMLYGAFIIYSASTVFAKLASQQNMFVRVAVFLALEVMCLGGYALGWQQVLKRFTLITAMASKGVVVIFNLIWSVLLFSEVISLYNIIGAAVIIIGIWMVSSDG